MFTICVIETRCGNLTINGEQSLTHQVPVQQPLEQPPDHRPEEQARKVPRPSEQNRLKHHVILKEIQVEDTTYQDFVTLYTYSREPPNLTSAMSSVPAAV